jgi:hypothetical protein
MHFLLLCATYLGFLILQLQGISERARDLLHMQEQG